jgi:SAM-dependent methyltransferase
MPFLVSHETKNRLLHLHTIPILGRLFRVSDCSPTPHPHFWRNTAYQGGEGRLVLRLLGLPVVSLRYSMSVEDVYAVRGNPHLEKGLAEMIAAGVVEPVTAQSRVVDSGCNVGTLLRYLANQYACEVIGVDVSTEAIDFAREKMLFGYERATFFCQDVLQPGFFNQFPDGHFSHVFCSSHLIHLPPGPDKLTYLEHLKRIGRNLIVFERMPHKDQAEPSHRHPEDFIVTQGFRLFKQLAKANPKKFMALYYWRPDFEGD